MRFLLLPFAVLYSLVMRMRNLLYDLGLLKSFGFDTPIVSVGNLSAGGTGKTPLTALLVQSCLDRGLRVAIVSRGYHSQVKSGWARVPSAIASGDAEKFGDEPCWYAERFPQVPVYVGPDRSTVVRALLMPQQGSEGHGKNKIDLIFADDAFQHRRLRRTLDLVVIDATQPRWHYHSLPAGRLREGFASLTRASLVFVTKCNFAEASQLEWLNHRIKETSSCSIICTDAVVTRFFDQKREHKFSFVATDRLLLVSGIGRPQTFEAAIRQATPAKIAGHLIFHDHQQYDKGARQKMVSEAARLGVDAIVVTEKDAVKLIDWQAPVPLAIAELETRLTEAPNAIEGASSRSLKDFYEALDRVLR